MGRAVFDAPIPVIVPASDGTSEADCFAVEGRGDLDVELLRSAMPKYPLLIIDLSLWDKHSEVEKKELVEQIISSIGYVREYLWDGNLLVSSAPSGFMELFNRYAPGMRHMVHITSSSPLQFMEGARPAVLDPYGDTVSEGELRGVDVLLIGGIVDKERKISNETFSLYRSLGLDRDEVPRYKLTLWGSRVGVPDRINKIVKIVLDVVVGERGLDNAILAAQSNKDRLQRLIHELQVRGRVINVDGERRLAINENELKDIISRLGVNEKVLRRATRGIKLLVED